MTDEQRMDRLERIVKLMVKAGLRARRQMREQDEKINILIDGQIKNGEQFAENGKRFAALAEAQAEMARSQAETGAQLKSLIATVDRVLGNRGNGGA